MDESPFMLRAIELSRQNVAAGGGPFGAVVVRDGRIIGEGTNRVLQDHDPTAHAEVVAIRMACEAIGSYVLDGATVYTSCEPCPMCLAAIWWSRASNIVYGNSRADAASIGFDDAAIYDEIVRPLGERKLPLRRLAADKAREVFDLWLANPDRILY